MPEDALLKTLEDEAKAQAGRLLEEAEQEASEILKDAEVETLALRDDRLRAAVAGMEKMRAASVNSARMRAEGLKLEARHGIIDDALRRSVEGFRAIPKEERSGIIKGLYRELKKDWEGALPDVQAAVRVNPEDTGIITDAGVRAVGDPQVSLGAVFTSSDGRVRYENTIPSRVKKAKAGLVPFINALLFG